MGSHRVGHNLATKQQQNISKYAIHTLSIYKIIYMCIHTHTYIYPCESESHSVVSDSLQSHRLYSPWNSPGQNTGVGSFSFLQGIFPTQPSLPHCRQILYQLSHKGSPTQRKAMTKNVEITTQLHSSHTLAK